MPRPLPRCLAVFAATLGAPCHDHWLAGSLASLPVVQRHGAPCYRPSATLCPAPWPPAFAFACARTTPHCAAGPAQSNRTPLHNRLRRTARLCLGATPPAPGSGFNSILCRKVSVSCSLASSLCGQTIGNRPWRACKPVRRWRITLHYPNSNSPWGKKGHNFSQNILSSFPKLGEMKRMAS